MDKEQNNPQDAGTEETGTGKGRWEVNVSSDYDSGAAADSPAEALTGEEAPASQPEWIPPVEAGYPVWVNILAIVGVLVASTFIGRIMDVIVRNNGGDPSLGQFLSYSVSFGITIAFAWWITTRKGTVKKPFNFSLKRTNPTLILWGFVLVTVTSMVLEPLLDIFPREYMDMLQQAVGSGGWAMLTTIVAAPILEEILFRGIIQQEITGAYGRIKGLLLASAVFGIIHIIPQQAINAFFIGIILGYIYIRSGSLVAAIVIHAINNAIAFTFMQLLGDKFTLTKDLFGSDIWYWTVYAVCCAIFLVAGWNLMRELRRMDQAEDETA